MIVLVGIACLTILSVVAIIRVTRMVGIAEKIADQEYDEDYYLRAFADRGGAPVMSEEDVQIDCLMATNIGAPA